MRELVAGSFLEDAPIVAVSSKTGGGPGRATGCASRPCLARHADAIARGSARLPIDRVFTVKGFGTVVTGTLVSGRLREGQNLAVLPRACASARAAGARTSPASGRRRASASRSISAASRSPTSRAERRLCEPGAFEPTRRLDVVIELLPDARPLRHGARVRFHQGTSEIIGRVALAARCGTVEPLAELPPGASAYARIRLERPAVLTRGDRFILRAYSPPVTIGGGVVLDPLPPRAAIRTPIGIERLQRLDASAPFDEVLETLVDERGLQGLPQSAVLSRAGAAPAQAEASLRRLSESGKIVAVGDVLLSRRLMDQAANRLLEALTAHHAAEPMSEGLHREEARAKLMPRALSAVFDAIVAPLVAGGRVTSRDRLSLAGHAVSLSPEEGRIREAVLKVFFDAGLSPPDVAGARSAVGGDAATVDRIINLLVRQRALVKVDTLLFHAERLEALKTEIRALKTPNAAAVVRFDVASFKERYGITRKFAIPLLEYLDRERVTRRVGESRVLV